MINKRFVRLFLLGCEPPQMATPSDSSASWPKTSFFSFRAPPRGAGEPHSQPPQVASLARCCSMASLRFRKSGSPVILPIAGVISLLLCRRWQVVHPPSVREIFYRFFDG